MALHVARQVLPDYSHPCSPKLYTQPQLFACLVYMAMIRADYRGVEAHLKDLPAVREWIGLERTPDHATLHRAAQRFFGSGVTDKLLASAVRLLLGRRRVIRRAAVDSTGLESRHCSAYFVRRRARGQKHAKNPLYQTTFYTRYPKFSLLVDCDRHLILAMLSGSGPKPDIHELAALLSRSPRGLTLRTLLADAGYDSEANHRLAREEHGIRSIIPPTHGRPRKDGKPPGGYWRQAMHRLLRSKRQRKRCGYTQRWQIETVMD